MPRIPEEEAKISINRRMFLEGLAVSIFSLLTSGCALFPSDVKREISPKISPTPSNTLVPPAKEASKPLPAMTKTKPPSSTPTPTLKPKEPTETKPSSSTPTPTLKPTETLTLIPTNTPTKERVLVSLTPPESEIPDEIKKTINNATAIVNFDGESSWSATGVHIGSGYFVTCKHALESARGNSDPASVILRVGHPAYKFFKAQLVFYPPQENIDLVVLKINLAEGGYASVKTGNPDELRLNDTVIVMNYQRENDKQGPAAIHFHQGKFLGQDPVNQALFVAENLDPWQKIKTSSAGASGGGAFFVKDNKPYLIGTTIGFYSLSSSQPVLEYFGARPNPQIPVVAFTSIKVIPAEIIG